jgi:hypothetical protein
VTYDWVAARRSLEELAKLRPAVIASGHGIPMAGENLADELEAFSKDFVAPKYGRYVAEPARFDENGVVFVPPAKPDYRAGAAAGVLIAAVVGIGFFALSRRRRDTGTEITDPPVDAGPMRIEDLEG